MKKVLSAGAALLLTTSIAQAGGLDRSGQGVGIIFEEGNVVQLSFGLVKPEVTGETTSPFDFSSFGGSPVAAGSESGNVGVDYTQFSGGVKYGVNEKVDLALIFDQPFGAEVSYADADAGFYVNPPVPGFDTLSATASSSAITALARYKFDENFSVHGGLRYQTVEVAVDAPLIIGYSVEGESASASGFVLGGAYEIPAIALRVALTYNSKISYDMKTTENCNVAVATGAFLAVTNDLAVSQAGANALCGEQERTTSFDTPESLNLDFQTGIAEDTLLFGSVRYAKWTQFDFRPVTYATATALIGTGSPNPDNGASVQSYDEDTFAYSIGVGRRLNDNFSAAVSVGFEPAQGGFAGPLAPTDGNKSIGLGGTYSQDGFEITAGVRYIMIGDAKTAFPGTETQVTEFKDNSAIGFGMQISRSF